MFQQLRRLRRFAAVDGTVLVGVELGHAIAPLAAVAATLRALLGGNAAVLVRIHPIEMFQQLRRLRRFAAVDRAVLVDVELGHAVAALAAVAATLRPLLARDAAVLVRIHPIEVFQQLRCLRRFAAVDRAVLVDVELGHAAAALAVRATLREDRHPGRRDDQRGGEQYDGFHADISGKWTCGRCRMSWGTQPAAPG